MAFYLWLVSVGSWVHWPSLSHTYDDLASAFLHGQLSLLEAPAPELLAIENPFDPGERRGVPFPLDVSLFDGRFYLYFGPVPALILTGPKLVIQTVIGDEVLVFAFTGGLFIVQALLAFAVWKRFFPDASAGALAIAVLVLGMLPPAGWLLSMPRIYAAAVMAGAFFLAAGTYAAFFAFDEHQVRPGALVAAGILWGAAVGSRITQAVPVVLLVILLVAEILKRRSQTEPRRAAKSSVAALLLPLAAWAAVLGWYNWARFGSVLESGISYQLSGGFQANMGGLFSPLFVPQNLYNYLMAPIRLGFAFPYFKPTHGLRESVLPNYPLPDIYWSSQMAGLLYTAPFIAYAALNALYLIRKDSVAASTGKDMRNLRWLFKALWLSFISSLVLFLSFFWSAERYMADFVPAVYLLSVIGFWQAERKSRSSWLARLTHLTGALVLVLGSLTIGNLLAISFNAAGFRALNPAFWRMLGNLFRP